MNTAHVATSGLSEVPVPARGDIRLRIASVGLLLAGAALAVGGGMVDPHRFAAAWLWGFAFLWTLVVGSIFFVALQHLTASVWSVVVRRVAEAIAAHAWLVAVCVWPVIAFAWFPDVFHVFLWADPDHLAHSEVLAGKAPYLNVAFFTVRAVAFVTVWAVSGRWFTGQSLAQDSGREGPGATVRMRKVAPVFVLLFGVSVTFGAMDWLMSLDPHWYSTIFGVYVFAGMFVTALAAITLGVLALRATGRLGQGVVRPDHLWSLGALVFGMTCFWAYIAFSQFMLIWYGNLPEETAWYQVRVQGGWEVVSVLLPVVRFALPFVLLLPRSAKTDPRVLAATCLLVVGGQAMDLYWMVMPAARPDSPLPGWIEVGPVLAMTGALGLGVERFLDRHAAVAVRDPLIGRSLEHQG